jgi:hypothetical protein
MSICHLTYAPFNVVGLCFWLSRCCSLRSGFVRYGRWLSVLCRQQSRCEVVLPCSRWIKVVKVLGGSATDAWHCILLLLLLFFSVLCIEGYRKMRLSSLMSKCYKAPHHVFVHIESPRGHEITFQLHVAQANVLNVQRVVSAINETIHEPISARVRSMHVLSL